MHTTDQLNTALAGRYAIDRLIGEGGMATVYLARDVRHNRRVALKVLKPDLGAVVGSERFLSEIQVTANLQHPNLLPLFDSGAADSLLFYVMPYVEGESLRARLQREKQLPIDEAVRMATSIASALDYAHRHGVIHRDLKPENVLLHEGQPLVADFGIALAVSNAGGNRITQTGLSLGTPQYMSPEQATGDRVIDARTDIYSLGAVTYEMLTGEPPHMGNTSQAVIARVLTERPRAIRLSRPNVPEQIEAAVDRALEKLPADRWASAKEFSEAITGARIITRSTAASTAGSPAAVSRRPGAREIAAWTVAVAALGGLAFVSLRDRRPAVVPVPAQFPIQLPDSLDTRPRGGAATIAVSPDGSTIVFQATPRGGTTALYVRSLDDRSIQRIRGTDSARAPVLSPDGNELLFVPIVSAPVAAAAAAGTGGISVVKHVPLRGGTARTIIDSAAGNGQVSWGDGGLIMVAHRNRLWTAPPTGGPRMLLAAPDSSRQHVRYGFPDILPGGRAAVITIWKGNILLDSTVLGIVTIPEGAVSEIGIRGTFPRYSSTGHLLYATSDSWLNAVPFDARKLRVTGAVFPVAEGLRVGGGGAAAFGVGRNGTLAYLAGGEGAVSGLQVVAVNRTGVVRSLGVRLGLFGSPRVSPDGRQIALAIPTGPGPAFPNPDIWRFDTSSKAMVRVTTDSASLRPSWTRDGERIAYVRRPLDTVVMWRPLYSAGQAVPLFHHKTAINDFALGTPNGYAAIKIDTGTNRSDDIWLVHMDSIDSPRPFLTEPYAETSPSISADGAVLAYMTNRTGTNEIYVRPILGGGSEVKVSVNGGTEPVWSRTGRELFYRGVDYYWSAQIAEGPRLSVVRRDSMFRDVFPRMGVQVANFDVFPGGQEFVVLQAASSAASTSAPLVVLMNWHLRGRASQPAR